MTFTVLRHDDHDRMPWRNGGGLTLEVARSPRDGADFDWRVSFAHVTAAGPFSAFPGIDRVITLVTGERLRLTLTGPDGGERVHDLVPFEPFAFAGEDAVVGEPFGPTVDLNVMTRRGACRAQVQCRRLAGEPLSLFASGSNVLVAVLDGAPSVREPGDAGPTRLAPFDVVADVEGPLELAGAGVVAIVHLD